MKTPVGKDAACAPLPTAVRIGGIVAASALACVLALVVVLGNGSVSYRYDITAGRLVDNAVICAALVLFLIIAVSLVRHRHPARRASKSAGRRRELSDSSFWRLCALVCIAVFLVEALITRFAGFLPGWDAMTILNAAVEGTPPDQTYFTGADYSVPYFDVFPNNVFLYSLFSFLSRLVPGTVFIVTLSCACVSLSIFLVSRIVLSLTSSKRWAAASLALSILLIGLLPWFFVPYSDVFGLICVTSALWAHTCLSRPLLRWPAFFAFSALGYLLKPTAVFLPAAIVLVSAIVALKRRPVALRRALRAGAGALAGCGLAALVYAALVLPTGAAPDPDKAFGAAHFLMMGLNEQDGGGFSHDDVEFSMSQPDEQARSKADLEVALQRVKDMGFAGTAELFVKKTLSNYNDGTFAWGQDMPFFPSEFRGYTTEEDFKAMEATYSEKMKDPVSRALASYYWGSGRYYQAFQTAQQAVWLATLLGAALCLAGLATPLHRRLDPRATAAVVAVLASLVMLTVFLMVFECRARYLYLYAGLYVVAAVWGYRCLIELTGTGGRRRVPSDR